ncbi:hypothetical protein [Amphritea sp.]|uniref:hypothetical protein n=1 Tax=Amphritea sp. TaxID=1872502 RepID=UPI003A959F69
MTERIIGINVEDWWAKLKNAQLVCAPGVKFSHRVDGGASWWLMQKEGSEHQYRIDDLTRTVLQQLNGRVSLEQIWLREPVVVAPDMLAKQIAQLIELGLVMPVANSGAPFEVPEGRARKTFNPVSFVFFTFNPNAILAFLSPLSRLFFSKVFAIVWCLVIGVGLLLWLNHQTELYTYLAMRASDPAYLVWFWLVYPCLKAVHEIAHGLAVWKGGGRVKKAGLMLLVFMPVPFVDASDSSHFSAKQTRMLVAAAGVMAELFLASIGLMVWCFSEQPVLQEIGFVVALIGSVSTLLFNANPLLRFDGYYFFADWIEVPNLATRAQLYFRQGLLRRVFGLQIAKPLVCQPREKKWLLLYGPAALCYRLVIILVIVALVSDYFLWLGVCIAVWALWIQLFRPLGRIIYDIWLSARTQGRVTRFSTVMLTAVLLVVLVLCIPLQTTLLTEAVIVLPEQSQVRVVTEGMVKQLHNPGREVKPGDLILALENPDLLARRDKVSAELKIKQNLRNSVLLAEPQRASLLLEQIGSLQKELSHLDKKVAGLSIIASESGMLVIDRWQDLEGRYIEKGELLGFVYQSGHYEVQAVVSVAQAKRLKREGVTAEVRFASYPDHSLAVKQIRAVPQAITYLPDAVLGSAHGGDVLVDMTDDTGLKTLHPMFQFNLDLAIAGEASAWENILNQRVPAKTALVKFTHSPHSLLSELIYRGRELMFQKAL